MRRRFSPPGTAKGFPKKPKIREKKYEGMCVGLANGKVVAHSVSIKEVMNDLFTKHKGEQIAVISVPKKDKVLVL